MSKLSFNSDLHVHTNLSPCAAREALPESYLAICADAGLDTIGFSNHLWDSDIPGANAWYSALSVPHLMQIRDQIADTYGVRVLIGCEAEFTGKLALTPENAVNFDYVLISTSHFHHPALMEGMNTDSVENLRLWIIERFLLAVGFASELPVPVSLSHPFHPLGFFGEEKDALNGISDRMFKECFSYAARKNVAIELHLATLQSEEDRDENDLPRHTARMIRLAMESGCRFTFGTDEHHPGSFVGKNHALRDIARKLGITPDMMMEI